MTRPRSKAVGLAADLLRCGFARFNTEWPELTRIYLQVLQRRWSWYVFAVLLPLDLAGIVMRRLAGWRAFQSFAGLGLGVWIVTVFTVTIVEYRRYRQEPREPAAMSQDSSPERQDRPALDDIPGDVIRLVAAGKKIQAIKRYREVTGIGLKEAKTIIDGL